MTRLSLALPLLLALAIIDGGSGQVRSATAAQESLLNCNQLEPEDRCDCNRRVLRALLDSRVATSDPVQSANSTPPSVQDAVQQEYRHRLRTFIAPGCDQASSPSNLPAFDSRAPRSPVANAIPTRLRPLSARDEICGPGCKSSAKRLLEGRWDGWLTLADGKPTAMFLHIIEVRQAFVRACSTHGMIFGVLRDGFLELPGPRSAGLTYTFRLWRGGPTQRDLEGVVLLDLRPNEESVGGLVWLSPTLRMPGSLDPPTPTGYACEDRDLEDARTGKKPPELKKVP